MESLLLPETVLCIVAHPDDIDFGASGTVKTLTSKGVDVHLLVATRGGNGALDENIDPDKLKITRVQEQMDAAQVVGFKSVEFLDFPDGYVETTVELRKCIAKKLREIKPDAAIIQSPEISWQRIFASHPDHRAVGEAALAAIYPDARNPYSFPELMQLGLMPHVVKEVWLMSSPTIFSPFMPLERVGELKDVLEKYSDSRKNHHLLVNISDALEHKIQALLSHKSQIKDANELRQMITNWHKNASNIYGSTFKYAEFFHVVNTA